MVLTDNMEAMVEASRVFGNLTRQKSVRDYLVDNKGNFFNDNVLCSTSP